MAEPPLGILKLLRIFTHLLTHVVHCLDVGVESLTIIEPVALRDVHPQHLSFLIDHCGDIDIEVCINFTRESIVQPVREGVVEGHVFHNGINLRNGVEVGHPPGKSCRHPNSGRIHVILHVVEEGRNKDDIGGYLTNNCCHFTHQVEVVEHLHIVGEIVVPGGAQESSCILGLFASNYLNLFTTIL